MHIISYMAGRKKSPGAIESLIQAAIVRLGRGAVFVPADFLQFGSREAVDVSLHRLNRQGFIRRLARGIYDFPKAHKILGPLTPSAEAIAKALAGRDRTRLLPSGAYAANLLGLTEQVPAKLVFLTDGSAKTIKIGPMTIQLRHTTPKALASADRLSGLLIQAFRELGQDHINPARLEHLRKSIPQSKRRELLQDLQLAPTWMQPLFRQLAGD